MKFGKHIQRRQLELPEYSASFVDYKALKKLIKKLSLTPVILPQIHNGNLTDSLDPQASLQANRAMFFFRLDREIEKVNTFYLLKEAELQLRLATLLGKKDIMQSQPTASKLSSKYIAVEEGFQQFGGDLNKLQQFVEVNATAFSKILKKWDKASKSEAKETYLSRAVDVQPCFNRDVISELSDQATTNLLDFSAWAEGERVQFGKAKGGSEVAAVASSNVEDDDLDTQLFLAITTNNKSVVAELLTRLQSLPDTSIRISRAFLATAAEAPEDILRSLSETGLADFNFTDEINKRTSMHVAAITGREFLFEMAKLRDTDFRAVDAFGRLPLHYASMQGRLGMIVDLLRIAPDTINTKDYDGFTPLIHAINHSLLPTVDTLLSCGARVDPTGESDHIPLNLACQTDSATVLRLLLARQPQILPDAEGLYPQHLVARSGKRPELLQLLRDSGADLDQPDKLYQWTPLFHAASEGNFNCLRVLLESGANVGAKDEKKLSALHYATWEGHIECIQLLSIAQQGVMTGITQPSPRRAPRQPPSLRSNQSSTGEPDSIPDLRLPPPIIPFRRYGHNFLDTRTFVIISFDRGGAEEPIHFYEDHKYPAARLTISSKYSDLIPRNLRLPIQDEFRAISFQIDNLENFSIDFDIYPTFGSKVIARTVASSSIFTGAASSSGHWHLELFDQRLHAIGYISFNFQVVKPFHGIPLEITQFATYWKATSHVPASDVMDTSTSTIVSGLSSSRALVTGSSLSGSYVRLFVQLTADLVPILYPGFTINHAGLDVPIQALTLAQFRAVAAGNLSSRNLAFAPPQSPQDPPLATLRSPNADISAAHAVLATSFSTLRDALAALPPSMHVELHVLYPTHAQEATLRLGSTPNINDFVDALLTVVFEHARHLRDTPGEAFVRSVVFSSHHPKLCTALNWKQPNYPVLLCNELPTQLGDVSGSGIAHTPVVSVKDAVRIAGNNNFMGLMCSSQLLELAPALKETIKVAGLVLVRDMTRTSGSSGSSGSRGGSGSVGANAIGPDGEGVDGVLRSDGVLVFSETIDM